MKFVIQQGGVKREIEGPFQICCSRADLETLRQRITEQLGREESPFNYGWFTIYEVPRIESAANTPPSPWSDSRRTEQAHAPWERGAHSTERDMNDENSKTDEPSVARAAKGYAAMGKPVPYERRGEALRRLREMDPALPTEEAMGFIERLSHALGRDQPYDCLATVTRGTSPVDLCGVYRLMAVLLTPAPSEAA